MGPLLSLAAIIHRPAHQGLISGSTSAQRHVARTSPMTRPMTPRSSRLTVTTLPRMSFNLATILRESANATPDKPLAHIGDLSFSYAQVDEISGRVAGALLGLGLQPGDKVAVQLPNLPHFLFTYF